VDNTTYADIAFPERKRQRQNLQAQQSRPQVSSSVPSGTLQKPPTKPAANKRSKGRLSVATPRSEKTTTSLTGVILAASPSPIIAAFVKQKRNVEIVDVDEPHDLHPHQSDADSN
jgi:hypothetical protein